MIRVATWSLLFLSVCSAGCQRPPMADQRKPASAADSSVAQPQSGSRQGRVGTPTGLSGPRQIVAATDFVAPKTAEELVAQMLRAIHQEDHDALQRLYYRAETSRGYANTTPQEQREEMEEEVFSFNKMGIDKERWGIKRLIIQRLEEPLPLRLREQTVDGIRWVRSPAVTHEINVQYDWEMRDLKPPISGRLSGWWIGEQNGGWFICTNQRGPTDKE